MHDRYEDLIALAGERQPLWWDKHGCPRFTEHHPKHCPNIYASEVVLLLIACQGCEREFPVQLAASSSTMLGRYMKKSDADAFLRVLRFAEDVGGRNIDEDSAELVKIKAELASHIVAAERDSKLEMTKTPLADEIRAGYLNYGDPPNADCCPAGPTMSSHSIRVLEYWHRPDHEWKRDPSLEIAFATTEEQ